MNYLSKKEMTKVDSLAVKKYKLPITKMMEKAGKNLAQFVSELKPMPKKVIVFFGKGNNGGGGLVAAKYLSKKFKVEIIFASRNVNSNVRRQLRELSKKGIKPQKDFKAVKGDVIIDALLGYNLKGSPKGRYKDLINTINFIKRKGIKVISLDLPSGVDPNKGTIYKTHVKANYTLTLALPKIGLKKLKNVYLANIGIPKKLYVDMGIEIGNYFKRGNIIKIS